MKAKRTIKKLTNVAYHTAREIEICGEIIYNLWQRMQTATTIEKEILTDIYDDQRQQQNRLARIQRQTDEQLRRIKIAPAIVRFFIA